MQACAALRSGWRTSRNIINHRKLAAAGVAAEAPSAGVCPNLMALIRQQLFIYRDLFVWLSVRF